MRMTQILIVAMTLVAASVAARSGQADFEIKGLRIGMSEAEFKKLNPAAKCESPRRDKAWDSSIARLRTCSVPGFTLATKEAKNSLFAFYDDKLGSWNATFYEFYGADIQEALAAKFGPPRIESNLQSVSWRFGDTAMHLAITKSSALMLVQSDISITHRLKLEEIERRKGRADL